MRCSFVFVYSALAAFVIAYPLQAAADQWRVHHGIACMSTNYSQGQLTYYGLGVAGQIGNESQYNVFFNCPIENDSHVNLTDTAYRTLSARGWANSAVVGTAEFFACRTYAGGGGGACGPAAKSNAVGVYLLNVDVSVWVGGNNSDALYVAAKMAPPSGGSANSFWQYRVTSW